MLRTKGSDTMPGVDGPGGVNLSRKDGKSVSSQIRICDEGLTGETKYYGATPGVCRTGSNDNSLLAKAGNGGWQQQQQQQQPSGPLPLPAKAGDGGGHQDYCIYR